MKNLIAILFFTFSFVVTYGQQTYKSYKIVWDIAKETNFVVDTLTNKKFEIDYMFSSYENAHRFANGFVYVKTGDMRGLMDLSGRKLLTPCHFIWLDEKDSLISAYVCSPAAWIFLNFKGDTISYGRTSQNNYCPNLADGLTAVHIQSDGLLLWGYLDKKARWMIKPKYQEAKNFEKGIAKVKTNGKWGVINEKGEYIVEPVFDSENFE